MDVFKAFFLLEDLRPRILITVFTLASLSTIVLVIRFCTRKCIVGKVSMSDYMMACALLLTWGLCACNYYQLSFGSGTKRTPQVPPTATQEEADAFWNYWLFGSAISWYAYHIGYLSIMCFIKLSILFFYIPFATQRTFRRLVITSIVIVIIISIYCILIVAFQCPRDPSYAVSPAILSGWGVGDCFDLRVVLYWQAGWSLGSDLVVLLLPMPVLLSLRMRRGKRLFIIAIFSVSLFVPIASAIRLWSLYLWANSGDRSRYYGGYIIFWSQVEINTAIICASAPSVQPLFKRMFKKMSCGQPSRGPSYYYGGRTSLPGLTATGMAMNLRRDSIDILETPTRAYSSSRGHVDDQYYDETSIFHSAEEEEIRARIRALSYPPTTYSRPTSPSSIFSLPLQRHNDLRGA
ncbi:hypothetical protein ACET3X_009371 [Alternaria dauci]|uniref:Rhodopsin domain-containing protein n=1 Tax=Alternaria dauci TaxID=48095 RepID=A0ABR3U973_9PLEO